MTVSPSSRQRARHGRGSLCPTHHLQTEGGLCCCCLREAAHARSEVGACLDGRVEWDRCELAVVQGCDRGDPEGRPPDHPLLQAEHLTRRRLRADSAVSAAEAAAAAGATGAAGAAAAGRDGHGRGEPAWVCRQPGQRCSSGPGERSTGGWAGHAAAAAAAGNGNGGPGSAAGRPDGPASRERAGGCSVSSDGRPGPGKEHDGAVRP